MKEGYELGLDVRTIWKCTKCEHRQDTVENEEWPYHCDDIMSIGATWQLVAVKATPEAPHGEREG